MISSLSPFGVFTCLFALGLTLVVSGGEGEKLPVVVAPQPIPFSHRQHAAIGMSCLECHDGARQKEQAGLPNAETCMTCHETIKTNSSGVKKLAATYKRGVKIKWVRVYQVPAFVFFSHANHLKADQHCASCHGPVEQRDVLAQEVSTKMTACIKCHTAQKASTDCYVCHQLGQ